MIRNHTREVAIDALEDLGLTESEARCFIALTQLPQGTAKEVSQLADIPRSRVYELGDRLSERGLVAVQDANPRRFRAVSVETAIETLEQTHQDRLNEAARVLHEIETADEDEQEQGFWTVSGREAIVDATTDLLDQADEEIFLILTSEHVASEEVEERLQAAYDRGVTIIGGSVSDEMRKRAREEFPDALIFEPRIGWGETPSSGGVGRLLMVDRDAVLTSAIEAGPAPGMYDETAIWGRGTGFDKVLRVVLEQRLERLLAEHDEATDGSGDDGGDDTDDG